MKKVFKSLSALLLATALFSCTEGDNPIYTVLNDISAGAAIRTVKIGSSYIETGDASGKFQVNLEIQDLKNGQDTDRIDVYVTFLDKTADNGSNSKPEVLLKSIKESSFIAGARELPYADLTITINDFKTKFGLTNSQYDCGDQFVVRLAQVMKDGRIFTRANASASVIGGAYFSSPYQYTINVRYPFPDASLFNGNYKVTEDSKGDYTKGTIVPVVYSNNNGKFKFRILNTNNLFLINKSSYYDVTVNPLTLNCTIQGNETFDYGTLKSKPTGTGSINVCNGAITFSINYSSTLQSQRFSLVKI